jgi:DNA topoisomerase I
MLRAERRLIRALWPVRDRREINASLPKGSAIGELTFNEALDVLAARAAAGPPKRKSAKRKTAKAASAAPKKSAAERRTARSSKKR